MQNSVSRLHRLFEDGGLAGVERSKKIAKLLPGPVRPGQRFVSRVVDAAAVKVGHVLLVCMFTHLLTSNTAHNFFTLLHSLVSGLSPILTHTNEMLGHSV